MEEAQDTTSHECRRGKYQKKLEKLYEEEIAVLEERIGAIRTLSRKSQTQTEWDGFPCIRCEKFYSRARYLKTHKCYPNHKCMIFDRNDLLWMSYDWHA